MAKISVEMDTMDVLYIMSEGNPGALTCIMQMMQIDPMAGMMNLLLLDNLEVYGAKIYMIWNDSCKRDLKKFNETLQAFREGRFSKEEIHENLNRPYAKPFI